MKTLAAALLTAMAMAVVPAVIAPAAHAEICAGADGSRHVGAAGCTDVAGDVAITEAAPDDAAAQAAAGQPPCLTIEGVVYWTPAGDHC